MAEPNAIDINTQSAIYYAVCPNEICSNGVAQTDVTFDVHQHTALVNTYRPTFAAASGPLVTIPDLDNVKKNIFTAAHHEDWNTAGAPFFNVTGKADDSNNYAANRPILCAILNANGMALRTSRKEYVSVAKTKDSSSFQDVDQADDYTVCLNSNAVCVNPAIPWQAVSVDLGANPR